MLLSCLGLGYDVRLIYNAEAVLSRSGTAFGTWMQSGVAGARCALCHCEALQSERNPPCWLGSASTARACCWSSCSAVLQHWSWPCSIHADLSGCCLFLAVDVQLQKAVAKDPAGRQICVQWCCSTALQSYSWAVVWLLVSSEHTVYFSVTQLVLNPWFLPLAREVTWVLSAISFCRWPSDALSQGIYLSQVLNCWWGFQIQAVSPWCENQHRDGRGGKNVENSWVPGTWWVLCLVLESCGCADPGRVTDDSGIFSSALIFFFG